MAIEAVDDDLAAARGFREVGRVFNALGLSVMVAGGAAGLGTHNIPAPVLGGHDLELQRRLRGANHLVAIDLCSPTASDGKTSDDHSHGRDQDWPPPAATMIDLERQRRGTIRQLVDSTLKAISPLLDSADESFCSHRHQL
jgi:hypothetical protein